MSLPKCRIYMCQNAHGSVFQTKNRNLFTVLTEGLESVERRKKKIEENFVRAKEGLQGDNPTADHGLSPTAPKLCL